MTRKRLTHVDIEDKAERIRKEYDYMDSLPEAGWLWELSEFINAGYSSPGLQFAPILIK